MKKIVSIINSFMKRIIFIILLLLTVCCGTIKEVPVQTNTTIEYRDSIVVKDSLIYIPKETIKEVVPMLDTLQMETDMATATAWLDTTTTTLKGTLVNKKGIVEKVKWREKIVYRDSIVTQEVPVEIEVEKIKYRHTFWDKLSWLISGLSISILIIYILKLIYAKR